MRNITKRTMALLLVLTLVLSLLPPIALTADAATVNYVTGSFGSFTDVVKNWGTRDEVATFLSPMAEEFYTGSNTYEEWSQLSGAAPTSSTNTSNVPESALYEALAAFMDSKQQTVFTSAAQTKSLMFSFTDCEDSDSSSISSFYSGTAIGPDWDSGETWNREHVWPNSKSAGGSDTDTRRETDIMMLRPTQIDENGSRSNKAYGTSDGFYTPNELGEDVRGDVARVALYVYTRWGNTDYADGCLDFMWGTDGVIESVDVLLDWMAADPVDTWEMGRNDAVQSITGARNVFVDYPELAYLLFNEEVPADLQSPSAAGESVAVTYKQNGVTVSTVNANTNTSVTLPAHSGNVATGYSFVGWVTEAINGSVAVAPTYYAAGASYKITGATTFHALYTTGGSTGAANAYEKVTSEPADWSGDYLIVYEAGNVAFDGSRDSSNLDADNNTKAVTITDGKIEKNATTEAIQFTIAAVDGGYSIQAASGVYIGRASTSNGMNIADGQVNTITWNNGNPEIAGSGGPALQAYTSGSNVRFRYYKTTQKAIALYKAAESVNETAYVTTTCAHTNFTNVAAKEATCEEPGNTAGKLCSDCGNYFGGYEIVPATGHDWDEGVVTEPTATEQGYTTYTCQNGCGETYVDDYKDPLGVPYTVTFVVPEGVTAIAERTVNANVGTTLPVPDVPTGDVEYTFHGWAESTCDNVTEAPTVKTGKFYPTQNVTLYAVYKYTVGGGDAAGDYVLTDLAAINAADNVVITMTNATDTYALPSTNGSSASPAAEAVTVNGNKIAAANVTDDLVWNISNNDGTLTISTKADAAQKLYVTNSNSGVRVGNGTENAFVIDDTYGYLFNTGRARYLGIYNDQDWRSYTSEPTGSSNIKEQTLGFYVQSTGGTAYFTTVIGSTPVTPPVDPEEPVKYTVTYAVPAGVEVVNAESVTAGTSVVLPTAGVPDAKYTFIGWAAELVAEDTETTAVTPLTGVYFPEGDVTLYPVYSYEKQVTGTPTTEWVKTDLANIQSTDEVVITMTKDTTWAMSQTKGSKGQPTAVAVSVSNNKLTAEPATALVWNITNTDGTLVIYPNGTTDSFLYCINDNNGLRIGGTEANQGFEIKSNYLYNTSRGRYVGVYASGNDWRSYTSINTNITGQTLGFYVKTQSGGTTTETYYTSVAAEVPAPPVEIKLSKANVDFGSSLTLNFNHLASDLDQYENVYVIFEAEGKETVRVDTYSTSGSGAELRYNFGFDALTVMDVNLTVYATIHGTYAGKEYVGETKTYSLFKYAMNALTKDNNDAIPCANLLKYAIAAEAKKGVETAKRLETVMTEEQKTLMENRAYADSEADVERLRDLNNGTQISFKSQNVDMESRIAMVFILGIDDPLLDTSKVTFQITYTDGYGNPATKDYAFSDLVKNGDRYELSFDGFLATQMRSPAKCTIYIDGVEHGYYTNSIENYCAVVINGNYTAEMQYLAKRISLYGDACAAAYGS